MRLAIIGVGSQSKKYIDMLLLEEDVQLDSLVDIDPKALASYGKLADLGLFSSVDEMLASRKPDVALVCLPHVHHRVAVEKLASAGVPVIKEKPHATSLAEAELYDALQKQHGVPIVTAVKRRYDPVFRAFPENFKNQIGEIVHFNASFAKNIDDLAAGWRASRKEAAGGALIDMGYHFVDVLNWYFGKPVRITSELSSGNREGQKYDVEDTANLFLTFQSPNKSRTFSGFLNISRVAAQEKEEISIAGTNGAVIIDKTGAYLLNRKGAIIDHVKPEQGTDPSALMLRSLIHQIAVGTPIPPTGMEQTKFIDDVYAEAERRQHLSFRIEPENQPKEPDFPWPIITSATERAVQEQLHKSVSIYNKSGVIGEFEDRFATYHDRKHGLLSNSGTTAIYSMFEALNLRPGDEVIAPAYTFFATVSPLIHTGASPVFVDCGPDGNIDASLIEKKITDKTKAVIVTHMWGIPCEMDKIQDVCRKNGIPLLEDCSHAHGAMYKGKHCGEFGDMAAWSLQGQKIITGGEGGIMLTNNDEYYYRAVLQGHYNKRSKQDIPQDHPLQKFALTGLGLKFRSHPLAVAMANEQFDHLDEWIKQKNVYAQEFTDVLSNFGQIILPNAENRTPSWYGYVFQVREGGKEGVTAKKLHAALQAAGLAEADLPTSTSPVYNLPLFTATHEVMPRLYNGPAVTSNDAFPEADTFYKQSVKLPVWTSENDRPIFNHYRDTLFRVLGNEFGRHHLSTPSSPNKERNPMFDQAHVEELTQTAFAEGIQKFVSGAFILKDDKLLIVRRAAQDEFLPGIQEIPSGGVDPGENLIQALQREVKEETALNIVAVTRYVNSFDYVSGSGKNTRQFNFLVETDSHDVALDPNEHSEFEWVDIRSPEFGKLNLSGETRRCIVEGLTKPVSGEHKGDLRSALGEGTPTNKPKLEGNGFS